MRSASYDDFEWQSVEDEPDGIHSGLIGPCARGVFFYFQAVSAGGKQHFWRYLDLKTGRVQDNRFLVAVMVACERDTPRVVEPDMFKDVFDCQEKVITDILRSVEEQKALEGAPRTVDPIQQTIVTVLQNVLNHPSIQRSRAIRAIRFLSQPMLSVQVRALREAYRAFQATATLLRYWKVQSRWRPGSAARPLRSSRPRPAGHPS